MEAEVRRDVERIFEEKRRRLGVEKPASGGGKTAENRGQGASDL